jgi:ABC-type amino acid transport substrate-binding protein
MNTDSELTQIKMLESNRCDYAYLNEWTAEYHLRSNHKSTKIFGSQESFDKAHGVIAFHPSWQADLIRFNEFTKRLRKSGELDALLATYIDKH